MSNIGNYNSGSNNPISYAKRQDYTERVENFVKCLHDFLPILQQEFDDLEKKSKTKPCKAFDDKMKGLSAIYQAEKDLHYWYIENAQRRAQ